MGEMQGIKKEDLNRIIHLFGERRKSRFGCEDYYTLCGYRREDGVLVHYDGTLLSSRNLDIPEKLTDFSLVTGMWPIEPKLLASAEEFFTHLAGGGLRQTDLCNLDILLKKGDDECWVNVSTINTDLNDEKLLEVLFINEDGEKILLKKAIYGSEMDDLTGTLNRNAVMRALGQMTSDGLKHTYLLLDIDSFKEVNLTFGYKMGDQVLVNVVNVIRKHLRSDDIMGRIGDDEFFICLYDVSERDVAERIAKGICEMTNLTLPGGLAITSSVGVTMSPDDGDCAAEIYGHTDEAMVGARKLGGNTFCFYSDIAK